MESYKIGVSKDFKILLRKMIAASVSGSLFAILLGFIVPNPFGQTVRSLPDYLFHAVSAVPVFLMYSFPMIFSFSATSG